MKMTFDQFDAIHPQVWNYFKRFAFEAIVAGHRRFSADSILHRIRWETTVVAAGRYKINNNFSADYARKFVREFPHYTHFFETRRRTMETPTNMYAFKTPTIEKQAAYLADLIVREESHLEKIDAALKDRKDKLEQCKTQLAQLLMQAGLESIKLEGGLTPKAKIVRKYFKQAGISDEQLFSWLNRNDLGGIIKPYVHFQTLQGALKDFECQGNVLPDDLFNITDIPTVVLYGKSKYLQQTESAAVQNGS